MEKDIKLYCDSFYHRDTFWNLHLHTSSSAGPMHTQDFCEFFLTATDGITYTINGTSLKLPKGSLVFAGPNTVHRLTYEKGCFEYINLSFTNEALNRTLRYLKAADKMDYLCEGIKIVQLSELQASQLFDRLKSMKTQYFIEKKFQDAQIRAIMAEVFGCYFLRNTEETKNAPEWLVDICNWIQADLNFSLSLEEIARRSGKSKEHFCRSMLKYKRITAMQYINQIRLNYVATMLESTDLPITELWLTAGFYSGAYFNKLFKNKFHMTARDYRKMF